MVVISIFLIITGVLFANMPDFRDKSFLQLIAQEIAITVRQAQVFGVGTRVYSSDTSFFPSHGIFFDILSGVENKTFVLFADKNDNNIYDEGGGGCGNALTECVEKFAINGAVKIKSVELVGSGCAEMDQVSLLFVRPYPEAVYYNSAGSRLVCSNARIIVESTKDPTRQKYVDVWNTGQISVVEPTP